MAFITNPTLQITPHPTDVNLLNFQIAYRVLFEDFDGRTRLPYFILYTIIGVDTPATLTGPPQDPATAEGNDTLATGSLRAVISRDTTFPDQQDFTDTIAVSRAVANEDVPPIPNPDELQVILALEPQFPRRSTGSSNIVKLNLP
jgi:hypothetical protein